MKQVIDHYNVLQVRRDATVDEIKKAYRKLAKQYHPDLRSGNAAKFKEIQEAYAVLSDPARKQEFDKKQSKSSQRASQKQQTTSPDLDPASFNVEQSFERFFSFNPKTKQYSGDRKTKKNDQNPLDTSDLFESFFKPGKK